MTDPVDKFLSDAISAARDSADEGVDDGARTRLRLRESIANRGATRRKRFTLIAAVIASLFGSTAFAYWAGWRPPWSAQEAAVETHADETHDVSMRLPDPRRGSSKSETPDGVQTIVTMEAPPEIAAIPDAGLVAEVGVIPAPPPPPVVDAKPVETKPARTVPRVRIARPTPVETAPVEAKPAPVEVKPATAPVETKPAEPPPASRVTTPAPPVETPKPQPSAELAAYRHAHELHFRGGDAKAALRAWDDYLATYPNKALAPEARYNRALVLVKMSRWAEARAALAPFANAKVGAYRQKEAAEILAAIKDR
jgi:outer membrane biosynthesis protein TonB